MFPGMVYAILSRDPDFVEDLSVLLRAAGAEVYAAFVVGRVCPYSAGGSGREMCVVDPVFRVE